MSKRECRTRRGRRTMPAFAHLAVVLLWGQSLLYSQTPEAQSYQMPPKSIADLVDAKPTPAVDLDPTKQWLLIMERPDLATIDELAQPELRLAGRRINPRTNGVSRASYFTSLALKPLDQKKEIPITGLPAGARLREVNWSPDGKHLAFIVDEENGQALWIAETKSKAARKLVDAHLNCAYGEPFHWLPDNQSLICRNIPDGRGEVPAAPTVPTKPILQETSGKKAPARTYQDLLKDAHDEALLDYYLQSQVVRVTLAGEMTKLGTADIIHRAEPSPDGRYVLVETIHRPYSYLVPIDRFPYRAEIWDLDGKIVKPIADLPLAEEVPVDFSAVPTGPRSFEWRADEPATLCWAEAQDDGDPKKEVTVRDRAFALAAPFTDQPLPLIDLKLRYWQINWGDESHALVSEWWWQDRRVRTWLIDPSAAEQEPKLLFDYSWQDRYNDPGYPLMHRNASGRAVLLFDDQGKSIFLAGDGASAEGDRPFLEVFDLQTRQSKRLWRSQAPHYERPIEVVDPARLTLLTRRESPSEQPNYFLRDLQKNKITQVTHFPHPTPQLANVQKELIRYERDDSVKLTATLYLPPNYKKSDGPLPTLMWAYPTEYKSADAAGQVTDSPYRFVRLEWWSPVLWVALGYAVLDDPSIPIVGEGNAEPNDTYVEQLVASAKAAVDELVRRGVADPGRIAIAGHSYGAFMTANLLAHSDLFAAGIARSGAYNRTLTPFGFQAEERTLWQAPEVYFAMSPFMHADKVNEPILLIHGEADNNSGTFPMQSERFYNAIKGHGGTARLVMLPHESHGYRARESIMHVLWETANCLDRYVKNPAKSADAETSMK